MHFLYKILAIIFSQKTVVRINLRLNLLQDGSVTFTKF